MSRDSSENREGVHPELQIHTLALETSLRSTKSLDPRLGGPGGVRTLFHVDFESELRFRLTAPELGENSVCVRVCAEESSRHTSLTAHTQQVGPQTLPCKEDSCVPGKPKTKCQNFGVRCRLLLKYRIAVVLEDSIRYGDPKCCRRRTPNNVLTLVLGFPSTQLSS